MASDYYEILGVSKDATNEQIKKAYRKKALEHHPDRGGDQDEFKKVNEAYQTLGDPQKRSSYDRFGKTGVNEGFSQGFGNQTGGFGGFDFPRISPSPALCPRGHDLQRGLRFHRGPGGRPAMAGRGGPAG